MWSPGVRATHAASHFFHHAGPLVPAAVREVGDLPVPFGHVLIGVAQARCRQANQNLVVARAVELHLDDLPLAGLLHEQSGPGLHAPSPWSISTGTPCLMKSVQRNHHDPAAPGGRATNSIAFGASERSLSSRHRESSDPLQLE